ncbi:helix-turn-helix domain-containing protein [Roseburia faecis]|uniref:helix-turn-helix domain-containing protein n=1 Tax=Roseburia faecis TaxID=301302 RepID=UPI003F9C9EB7
MIIIAKRLLDIKETCEYLGIGQTKARELIRGHNGFGIQIGNRWYADKTKLDLWIERNTL